MIRSKINNFWQANISRQLDTHNLISISREAILHNYDWLQSLRPNNQIWPVLKSNAYGHGIAQVAKILQARTFEYAVVDSYYEALQIWQISRQKVLLMGPPPLQNLPYFNFTKTALVVYDTRMLAALGRLHKRIKIHLKINTGLNRQGLKPSEIEDFLVELKKYPQIELEGICSHLASSDDSTQQSYTELQEERFLISVEKVQTAGFFPKFIHLSNTAGLIRLQNEICNAARVGIGLYGLNPLQPTDAAWEKFAPLQPALRFTSKVLHLIELEPGDKVSYGGTFVASRRMRIGLLPVGYYEVFTRSMSNRAVISYKNRFLPLVGTICMNLCLFSCEDEDVQVGDEVEIISPKPGDKNSLYALAKLADTIPYEILVKLAGTIRRQIV